MTLNLPLQKIRLTPFVWMAAIWGILSTLVVLGFTPEPFRAFRAFGIIFTLCVLDLFFLAKTVAVVVDLVSYQGAEKQTRHAIRLAFWGFAKFSTLALLIAIIWMAREVPALSWAMGVGTLIIVPIVGGFWWSSLENQTSDRKQKRELLHA